MFFKKKKKIIYKNIFLLSAKNLISIILVNIITFFLFNINLHKLLLFNGIGNIIYSLICRNKFPLYMVPNLMLILVLFTLTNNYKYILGGFICYGIMFFLLSFVIQNYNFLWLNFLLPP